ncbi:MAG: NAD-dependent epimerase/dehydratase family protein [Lewinella sp.]|nr:NAD-dependent epimerase/dehydratase family protein [Lewinella sp.]
MPTKKHTVLGASGAMGQAVLRVLVEQGFPARAVSRQMGRTDVEVMPADLLRPEEARKAVADSSHVYLCVGLPYQATVWKRDWPIVMQNVIDACAEEGATLIFLDNIYLYGPTPLPVPFDETTSQQPTTRKGQARKRTADLLMQAMAAGKVRGVIGRSADFYGPGATFSPFYIAFLERMLQGKGPQWVGRPGVRHTYANVDDNARALVALALDESTHGQAWHLPVGPPITPDEIIAIFNEQRGSDFQISYLPAFLRKALSLFMPPLREVNEMVYQFNEPYLMSAEMFLAHFPDFRVTPYEEGIAAMIRSFNEEPVG